MLKLVMLKINKKVRKLYSTIFKLMPYLSNKHIELVTTIIPNDDIYENKENTINRT